MKYDPEVVNEVLFDTDPAMTMCKANDCFDEYGCIADEICYSVEDGASLNEAIAEHLYHAFGMTFEPETINDIADRINSSD